MEEPPIAAIQSIEETIKRAFGVRKQIIIKRINLSQKNPAIERAFLPATVGAYQECHNREKTLMTILQNGYGYAIKTVQDTQNRLRFLEPAREVTESLSYIEKQLLKYGEIVDMTRNRLSEERIYLDASRSQNDRFSALKKSRAMLVEELAKEANELVGDERIEKTMVSVQQRAQHLVTRLPHTLTGMLTGAAVAGAGGFIGGLFLRAAPPLMAPTSVDNWLQYGKGGAAILAVVGLIAGLQSTITEYREWLVNSQYAINPN